MFTSINGKVEFTYIPEKKEFNLSKCDCNIPVSNALSNIFF